MVNAVEVDGMGQIVGVLQGYPKRIALLYANHRRRSAQGRMCPLALKIFSRHAARFWRKNPQPGLDTGRNGVGRKRGGIIRRVPVQFYDFKPDMNLVRVAIPVPVILFHYGIGCQPGLHQGMRTDIIRSFDKGRNFGRIVRLTHG